MYTQCPNCQEAFRVTAEILQQAAGRVRCGSCTHVFDALDGLSEAPPHTRARADDDERSFRDTLEELGDAGNIRIEDTGVEWRVVEDDDDAHAAEAEKADDPSAASALHWTLQDDAEEPQNDPVIPESGRRGREEPPELETPTAAEERYDDNTPLPGVLDDDDEDEAPAIPGMPRRRAEDFVEPRSPEFDARQEDLALGEPEDWTDLLEEVGDAERAQPEPSGRQPGAGEQTARPHAAGDTPGDDEDPTAEHPAFDAEGLGLVADHSESQGESELGLPGDVEQPNEEEVQVAGDVKQHDEEELQLAGDVERHDDEDLRLAGDIEQHDEEELRLADDVEQHDEEELRLADDAEQHDEEELRLADDAEQHDEDPRLTDDAGDPIEDELELISDEDADADAAVSANAAGNQADAPERGAARSRPAGAGAPHVPPPTEDEMTIDRLIDQDLLRITGEHEDLAATGSGTRGPAVPQHVETIIMEGELVRSSLHGDVKLPEPGDEVSSGGEVPLERVTALKDTYIRSRDEAHASEESPDPVRYAGIAAAVTLGLLLTAQLVHANRETLATYGVFSNTVGAVYRGLGAPITPDWDVNGWQFAKTSGSTNASNSALTISTRLTNRSQRTMPYPLLHVTLTDRYEEVVASDLLKPAQYLAIRSARGMVEPGEDLGASVTIAPLSADAAGFELNVCYPIEGARVRCATGAFKRE